MFLLRFIVTLSLVYIFSEFEQNQVFQNEIQTIL